MSGSRLTQFYVPKAERIKRNVLEMVPSYYSKKHPASCSLSIHTIVLESILKCSVTYCDLARSVLFFLKHRMNQSIVLSHLLVGVHSAVHHHRSLFCLYVLLSVSAVSCKYIVVLLVVRVGLRSHRYFHSLYQRDWQ